MKRIVALLLTLCLLFTACTSSGAPSTWPPAALPPLGVIENNVYTSELLNLRFDGGANWILFIREEFDRTNTDFQKTGLYVDMLAEPTEEYMSTIGGIALVTINFVPYHPNPNAFTIPEELAWYAELIDAYNAENPADMLGYNIAGITYFYLQGDATEGYTQYYFLTPADENYMLIISVTLPEGMSIYEVTDCFSTIN